MAGSLAGEGGRKTQWRQALSWFVSSYPLLGALAAVEMTLGLMGIPHGKGGVDTAMAHLAQA